MNRQRARGAGRPPRGEGPGAVLPGTVTRRIPAALALLALAALALLAAGTPAAQAAQVHAARRGQPVTIMIGSISPGIAVPRKPVTLSGWVRNNTAMALQGLRVELWSSSSPFSARGQFDSYVAGSYQVDERIPGAAVALPATVGAGATVRWRASVEPSQAGMQEFGVYPLAAAVFGATSTQLAVERTFLPLWPGRAAVPQPLKISWIWPLMDQPHQGMCPAMLDNGLAASLGGGRLGQLLAAGSRYATTAKLTWAVDPALLGDVSVLTGPHQVLDGGRCWQVVGKPASTAARGWLAVLRSTTAGQPVFITPYADPDVSALSHHGLDADLRVAAADGAALAREFLDHPDSATAWPPGGTADAGVVDNILAIAAAAGSGPARGSVRAVVLDSSMMPQANPAVTYTPDAVTEVHSGIGTTVRVLLADHQLATVLSSGPAAAAGSATGPAAEGAVTAASQRFLAETAMIAAEAPYLPRSIVVTPPRHWDPGARLAARLLADTIAAPWLRPAYLGTLAPAAPVAGVPAPELTPLPANQVAAELPGGYLDRVRDLAAGARLFESILSQPDSRYRLAIARLESSAWRGAGEAHGRLLIRQAESYLDSQQHMVKLIPSSQVTLGGNRGTVPVSIENGLAQPVRIRLHATVQATRAVPAEPRLAVTSTPGNVITIGPHLKETVRLQVRARSPGLTEIHLRLLNPQGTPLPGSDGTLKVRSTAFGTLALVIIAVALGVLVLTFVARIIRRGMRDGRPGTVGAEGTAHDNRLAEAPDELADARDGAQPGATHSAP